MSTNDDVTYQQIELLKPLETVDLRSSPIQPIRDTIAGEDVESVVVQDAAIKLVDMQGGLEDVIVDAGNAIESRATESNIEPGMLANYPDNSKLDFSKGVQEKG